MASDPTTPDDAMLELVTTQHKMIMSLLDKNEALLAALEALRLQALQSNVNDRANEWGREALAMAHAAIAKAKGQPIPQETP